MRVGIYTDLRNPTGWHRPWDELYSCKLERIVEAERLGVHSVWVTEHHLFDDGYLPQPLTFAAAIAARTTRIRIGTAVMLAPLRHALQIAEEAAVVDILSGGRLELGLGAGYRLREFEAYDVDVARRFQLLEERTREIRRLWDERVATPPPLQERLPLWLGVMGPRGARMTGRLGEGLLWLDRSLLEHYVQGLEEGGHDPASARMGGLVYLILADDPEQAEERIAPYFAYQRESYRRHAADGVDAAGAGPSLPPTLGGQTQGRPDPRSSVKMPRLHVMTPDDGEAFLRTLVDGLPVTDVFLWESVAAMPDDLAERHVELVATKLAPALAATGAAELRERAQRAV